MTTPRWRMASASVGFPRTLPAAIWCACALSLVACGGEPASEEGTTSEPRDPPAEAPALTGAFARALAEAGIEGRALDDAGQAWAIAEVRSDSGSFVVQWADLGAVEVRQRLGEATDDGPKGFFHPTAPSPSFALLDPAEVVRQSWDGGALAVLNGAFFETPGQPSSQIAFPLAIDGRVATGGSSPYGPGRPGAQGKRWGRPLRAFGLDTLAHVADYNRQSGAPLGQPDFENVVVSYAPDAHPTRIATRFHVVGAVDSDGDGATETLVIVTSDGQTRIGAASALAERLGAAPELQIALDGGASVLVWTPRAGTLHQPVPIRGRPQSLPHYLVLQRR